MLAEQPGSHLWETGSVLTMESVHAPPPLFFVSSHEPSGFRRLWTETKTQDSGAWLAQSSMVQSIRWRIEQYCG